MPVVPEAASSRPTSSLPSRTPAEFRLDPPSATPFGIFHAAHVWPDGSWSTRSELLRMGRLDLVPDATEGEVDRAHDLVRTQSGADGISAPPDSDARSEETRPGDEGSFMQMQMQGRPGDVPTWEHLMEQFETWFVEGGDVRLLFQMVKDAAQKRLNLRYARWVQGPVSSLPGRTEAMTIRRGLWSRSPSGVFSGP